MDNRINVEKEIKESMHHEQFKYFVMSAIGVFVPFIVWALNYGKVASPIWWGFFTVLMIFVTVVSLILGIVKIAATTRAVKHYRKVLTRYANIDEKTHIPETATVTMCLRPDMGRFGLQKVNYFFWKDATELVFFPVRPEFLTSKAYHLVQSVRLNEVMVRYYSKTGNQYYDGIKDAHENQDAMIDNRPRKANYKPEFRDTRATLIAYAVGEQTIFLMFDLGLYDKLKEAIPKKDKLLLDELKNKEAVVDEPIEPIVPVVSPKINEIKEPTPHDEIVESDKTSEITEPDQPIEINKPKEINEPNVMDETEETKDIDESQNTNKINDTVLPSEVEKNRDLQN